MLLVLNLFVISVLLLGFGNAADARAVVLERKSERGFKRSFTGSHLIPFVRPKSTPIVYKQSENFPSYNVSKKARTGFQLVFNTVAISQYKEWCPFAALGYAVIFFLKDRWADQFSMALGFGYTLARMISTIARSTHMLLIRRGWLHFKNRRVASEPIQQLTQRIVRRLGINGSVDVFTLPDDWLRGNAFAASGPRSSFIMVHQSYVDGPRDRLEAVLGHEAAHILEKHLAASAHSLAMINGFGNAMGIAKAIERANLVEQEHISWGLQNLKSFIKQSDDLLSLKQAPGSIDRVRDLRVIAQAEPSIKSVLIRMQERNNRETARSSLYVACTTVLANVFWPVFFADRRKMEMSADAHALTICHPIALVSVLSPALIDFFKLPVMALYYLLAWLSPWSMWVVPLAGALHCMGVVDFTWPLKRLSGKTLKTLFRATGVIKKEQYSWWQKGLLWILDDASHPSTDERIDAILSKME